MKPPWMGTTKAFTSLADSVSEDGPICQKWPHLLKLQNASILQEVTFSKS